ncbi:MAG: FAD-dependent monooxygenase [Rhodanobacteraceae bacterium]|nr:MAG: FAD-dependent monooxygenase [Rhodanobacteraceae bacterium]
MSARPPITIVGAGLVGSLLATLLAQRGFVVQVFEKRPDPRTHGFLGGRSINLSLVERGLAPLRLAGLADAVLATTVTMAGRMVHAPGGGTNLQRYGINAAEVDHSVGRGDLNMLLLDAAERAGARLHFDASLASADFANGTITLADHAGTRRTHQPGLLVGCDGAGSALRAALAAQTDLGERTDALGHGYKELAIPARPDGGFALEPNALHIWPRGNYMCIALPNTAGNFTVTLFLPGTGAYPSFATLPDAAAAQRLFTEQFADALALMPTFHADWDAHPVGQLATLYLDRWNLDGRAVLLGDAAHAVVPFHGQGMNAGFEDAAALATLLAAQPGDPGAVFGEFSRQRKPNADAIAAMSIANYHEMSDSVADPHYLLQRELAAALTARVPEHFMARYRMVSFTALPYATCVARDREQTRFMDRILRGRTTLAGIDLDAVAARARRELPPLPRAV